MKSNLTKKEAYYFDTLINDLVQYLDHAYNYGKNETDAADAAMIWRNEFNHFVLMYACGELPRYEATTDIISGFKGYIKVYEKREELEYRAAEMAYNENYLEGVTYEDCVEKARGLSDEDLKKYLGM